MIFYILPTEDYAMGNKVDKKQQKEKRLALIKEHSEKNPSFQRSRKIIFYIVTVLAVLRIINGVAAMVMSIFFSEPISFDVLFYISIVFALLPICLYIATIILVAHLIYSGVKAINFVLIIGGVYSLYNAYDTGVFDNLNTTDMLLNVTNYFVLAIIFIQSAGAIFMLFNKNADAYFESMSTIHHEMNRWKKSLEQ
jgi:hypothetical protein